MKKIAFAAVAAALLGTSAFASDLPNRRIAPEPYAAPAPVFTWTGAYVGVNGGYGFSGKQTATSLNGSSLSGYGVEANQKGGTLGATAGFQVQTGALVTGVEGDLNWANFAGNIAGYDGATVKTNAYGTLRGRLGYAMGAFLPYVTGGLYYQHAVATLGGVDVKANNFGWTIGGGAEYALDSHWSVKGEYLYAQVKDTEYSVPRLGSVKADGHQHIVRAGVNYKF